MKAYAAFLVAAFLGNIMPVAAADREDVIETVNGIINSSTPYPLVKPGFFHKVCEVLTGGSCAEGHVLPRDIQCNIGTQSCNATNCSGSGAAYTCTLTYSYRICISGFGIDPDNPTGVPLYVNAYGYAQNIPGHTLNGVGIMTPCVESDVASVQFSDIPVQGKNVNISAYIRVAIGPPGSVLYENGTAWYTMAIHLPGPEQANLLKTRELVQDPAGTILNASAGVDATVVDYVKSYEGWDPIPLTIYPGPTPDHDDSGGVEDLRARVMLTVKALLP